MFLCISDNALSYTLVIYIQNRYFQFTISYFSIQDLIWKYPLSGKKMGKIIGKSMVFLDRHNTLDLRLYTEFDLNIKDMDPRNERKKLPADAGLRFH